MAVAAGPHSLWCMLLRSLVAGADGWPSGTDVATCSQSREIWLDLARAHARLNLDSHLCSSRASSHVTTGAAAACGDCWPWWPACNSASWQATTAAAAAADAEADCCCRLCCHCCCVNQAWTLPPLAHPARSERSLAAAAKYYELAQAKGLSLAQLALAWCKSRWYVASTM